VIRLFVPGRLCLFGEHSDWAGELRANDPRLTPGRCLVTTTQQGLYAEAELAPDVFEVSSVLPDGTHEGPARFPARVPSLDSAAKSGGFFSYAAGVAAEVHARHPVGGLRLAVVKHDLPLRKGLSSSAAVCVLVARAYGQAYELGLSLDEEMDLAYAGERRAGSECGRMDQVCALGRSTVCLTFDGRDLDVERIEPRAPVHLLVVDLQRGKDTRRILADLNRCFPDAPGELAANVREGLGPRNAALVERARRAVIDGDARVLGELMCEAQALFDELVAPACPELAAPKLHRVLASDAVRALAWGGKGVGSQGDGCAQLVVRGTEERGELAARLEREHDVRCLPMELARQW
jgi:galactokinase